MKNTIRKVVIPAAGLGTRFHPVTKVIPKEMLPILDTPILQMVVDEAIQSGIEEVILVTSPRKPLLTACLENSKIRVTTVVQEEPKGLGHAVWVAKEAVGKEPFLVLLPDELMDGKTSCIQQLIDAFSKTNASLSATRHTPKSEIHLYGVYDIATTEGRLHKVKRVVEKPNANEAPSDLSVIGRYLFTPEIFQAMEKVPAGKNNELQLSDAMNLLAEQGKFYAWEWEGKYFDTGNILGYLKANLHYGLKKFSKEEVWNF